MANLSKECVRRIRRMIKAVQAEPEYFNQNLFPHLSDCGAVCCSAGWAVWLDDPANFKRIVELTYCGGFNIWSARAAKALQLPHDTRLFNLFYSSHDWPRPFSTQYKLATSPAQRAAAFAARWEHFIQTDGAE